MNAPHLILADDLDKPPMSNVRARRPDGTVYRCRSWPFDGRAFKWRWRAAWLVFTGQADVLVWEGTPPGDDVIETRAEVDALLRRVPGVIARHHNAEKRGDL